MIPVLVGIRENLVHSNSSGSQKLGDVLFLMDSAAVVRLDNIETSDGLKSILLIVPPQDITGTVSLLFTEEDCQGTAYSRFPTTSIYTNWDNYPAYLPKGKFLVVGSNANKRSLYLTTGVKPQDLFLKSQAGSGFDCFNWVDKGTPLREVC